MGTEADKAEQGRQRANIVLEAVQYLRDRQAQRRTATIKPGAVDANTARIITGAEDAGYHRAMLYLVEYATSAHFTTEGTKPNEF